MPDLSQGLALKGLAQASQGQLQLAEQRWAGLGVLMLQCQCTCVLPWLVVPCESIGRCPGKNSSSPAVVSCRLQPRARTVGKAISCWENSTGTWERRAVETGARPTHICSRLALQKICNFKQEYTLYTQEYTLLLTPPYSLQFHPTLNKRDSLLDLS